MAKKKSARPAAATPVEAHKHTGDARTNIPTRELQGFVADDEKAPKKLLYPRDPSLDPPTSSGRARTSRTENPSKSPSCRSTSRKRSTRRR